MPGVRYEYTLRARPLGVCELLVRPDCEMDLTTPEALEFVVQAYIQAASEREDLELLHLLSTSPDDLPPSSDDNSDDDLPSFVRGGSERGQEDRLGVQPRPQDKGPPKGSTAILFSADAQTSFRFTREAVPTIADGVTGASTLSALLKGGSIDAGSDSSGKQLQIRVFGQPIPGDPMDVLVPTAATMAKVIALVLDQYMRTHSCEALCLESVDFELLMVRAAPQLPPDRLGSALHPAAHLPRHTSRAAPPTLAWR